MNSQRESNRLIGREARGISRILYHVRMRGASTNPPNRFDRLYYETSDWSEDDPKPGTIFLRDSTRSIVSYNDSPDVGFDASINPYRGCEHGCIYCYARPTHEYLGFSSGLDFETRILIKEDAPELLRLEFLSKNWKPQVLAVSGVTDPYQPIERRLELTRRCLMVCAEFLNPVAIVTKNAMVRRDADVLAALAAAGSAAVIVSITTLDARLGQLLEPRASSPELRLEAIRSLAASGIPAGVLVAPVIPALNDHELPAILEQAARAGARFAGYVALRLPHGVGALFEHWLSEHYPDRKEKVLNRLRDLRSGKLYDPEFFSRMRGRGPFAIQIRSLFKLACRKSGLDSHMPQLSASGFRRRGRQGSLF